MEIEWDATRTVIVFAPGVHSAQLQPTVFKWSVPSGYDTHLLISSPGVDVLMDMLLIWRALYSLWTWCYIDTLHWFTGEVQEHYTCEKVLPVAVCKGLISQLIMQGSPHYFDLMQWSFHHTQLQSAFWFYTPGQIIFSRCALVQWKIPWTIRCVSLQFWFHCCHADRKMYNPKTFQWSLSCCYLSAFIGGSAVPILLWLQFAIRDSLGPQEFFSSIKIGKLLDLLEMVELKPWPSWELLSSVAAVIRSLGAFHILATSVLILNNTYHIYIPYIETVDLQPTKIPCYSVLPAKPLDITDKCDLLLWQKQATTIQSSPKPVVDKSKQPFQMLEGLSFELLHWKNIRLLDLECSACCKRSSQQLFEWHIPWDSCSASGLWKLNFALLFSWDVTTTIDGVPTIKSNSGMFSHPLQVLQLWNYFAMALVLLSH
jgi:hypothetical protein